MKSMFIRCRLILLVAGSLWGWGGVGGGAGGGTARADSLGERLQRLIAAHSGEVSVSVKQLRTGEEYHFEADRPMPTASLIKLPLLVAAYGKIARSELSLDQRIVLRDEDKVPGSGILTDHFSAGLDLSLRDALHLMIVYSDNTATNLVADRVGLRHLNAEMQSLGLGETRMNSNVYRRADSVDPQRSERFGLGSTTSREIVRLLELLERGELHGREVCEQMQAHLVACDDRSKLVRFLPAGLKVAHKSGEVSDVRTEAGIIFADSGPIAIAVLTNRNQDQRFAEDNAAHILIGQIAWEAYRFFNPRGEPIAAGSPLALGAQGDMVADLQRTLNSRLEPSPGLAVDGEWGPATDAAVRAFQRQEKLPVSGQVDQAFWDKLGPLVTATPVDATGETPRQPADRIDGPPHVTAAAWSILDADTGEILAQVQGDAVREVASTTKIMTAWLILRLAESKPEIMQELVTCSPMACQTEGSSTGLKPGEQLSVDQLMYGLLLPSGNDGAVALAEHFGERLADVALSSAAAASTETGQRPSDPVQLFFAAMNAESQRLGLTNTQWTNPHGLPDPENHSTANELGRLAVEAMRLESFRKYVATRCHTARIHGPGGYQREITWQNTNRLLEIEGYGGIKTGTTNAAGACLVGFAERDGRRRVIVVLGSSSAEARFAEIRNLFRWHWIEGNR